MALPTPYDQRDDMTGNGKMKPKKGKGKGKKDTRALKGDDVYAMFGDDRDKFATEPLLPAPNSSGRGAAAF